MLRSRRASQEGDGDDEVGQGTDAGKPLSCDWGLSVSDPVRAIPNTKSEARNPKEIRKPKSRAPHASRSASDEAVLGFRISVFRFQGAVLPRRQRERLALSEQFMLISNIGLAGAE